MDLDEISFLENDIHLMRYRPGSLSQLSNSSGFSVKQVQFLYRNFKQECPNGLMTQNSFRNIFVQIFPFGDSSLYTKLLWKMMTVQPKESLSNMHSASPSISFEDFLSTLSTLLNGTTEDKLSWIFDFYDVDADGWITLEDMLQTVGSIYALMGSACQPQLSQPELYKMCQIKFSKLDISQQGRVTREEFTRAMLEGNFHLSALSQIDKSIVNSE